MRKCLAKFGRMFECGAEDACQKRFSRFFHRVQKVQKVQKCVNIVDLNKILQPNIYYLLAKIGVDTAENGLLKVCQTLAKS